MKLPSQESLAYWKLFGEVLLLLIVIPCVAWAVVHDPHKAIEHARIT